MKNSANAFGRLMPLSLVLITLLMLASRTPMLWAQANTVTFVVNTTAGGRDDNILDGICDIDINTEGEQCSLSAAISQHNFDGVEGEIRQIHFNIPGDGPHVLGQNTFSFGSIKVPITVDGTTQPGTTCPTADQPANLQIVLDMGGNAGSGLSFRNELDDDSGSVVRGLVIGNTFLYGLDMPGSNNKIECNHIGVAADGVTAMPIGAPATSVGIAVSMGVDSVVGGDESHAQRNVIASSGYFGVSAKPGSKILNNYIGTTADGLQPLGNTIGVQAFSSQIGGANALAGNVISGNRSTGLEISGENSQVWGNLIGVGADGVTAVPNGTSGVVIDFTTSRVTELNNIGGVGPGEANLITNNGANGITLTSYVQNQRFQLRGNRIFNNGGLGFDIGDDGPDTNDEMDVDDGANKLQNYPLLSSVTADGQIAGTLNSAASQTFEVDFYANANCDESGYGEGETYVGSTTVTTDALGDAAFDITISGGLTNGQFVTATAIDAEGNTSEFSQCLAVDTTAEPTPTPTSMPTSTATLTPTPTATPNPLEGYVTDCLTASGSTLEPLPTTTTVPTTVPTAIPPTPSGGNTDAPSIYLPFSASGGVDGLNVATINSAAINGQGNLLVDGGTVTGSDGVTIGAVAGTLMTETLVISITQTSAPTQTLIAEATIHGNYYHIAARRNAIFCGQEKGFVLGLPVPATADTDHLALAVLVDGSNILDGDVEGKVWILLDGLYDSNEKMFLTQLTTLENSHQTYALVTHPDFDSPNSEALQSASANATRFHIECLYFEDSSDCELEQLVTELALEQIEAEFPNPLYPHPRIRKHLKQISVTPPSFTTDGYAIYIEPSGRRGCGTNLGYYRPAIGWLALCLGPSGIAHSTIVHEYFHAIQFAFDPVLAGSRAKKNEKWIIEGMAAAAERSYDRFLMMRTTDFPLHKADSSLKTTAGEDKNEHYSAQDFWVHYGIANSHDLSHFRYLLQEGADSKDVANVLGDDTLIGPYWDWIKNQVMLEDGILLNEEDEGEPCTFQSSNVTDGGLKGNEMFAQPQTLGPLTSHIIKFDDLFIAQRVSVVWTSYNYEGQYFVDESVRFKFYIIGNGCDGALEDPIQIRHDDNGDIEIDTDFYVIVSNTHPTDEREYNIYGD